MCQMSKIVLVGRMPHWSAVSMVWNHGKDAIELGNNKGKYPLIRYIHNLTCYHFSFIHPAYQVCHRINLCANLVPQNQFSCRLLALAFQDPNQPNKTPWLNQVIARGPITLFYNPVSLLPGENINLFPQTNMFKIFVYTNQKK